MGLFDIQYGVELGWGEKASVMIIRSGDNARLVYFNLSMKCDQALGRLQ